MASEWTTLRIGVQKVKGLKLRWLLAKRQTNVRAPAHAAEGFYPVRTSRLSGLWRPAVRRRTMRALTTEDDCVLATGVRISLRAAPQPLNRCHRQLGRKARQCVCECSDELERMILDAVGSAARMRPKRPCLP